MCKDFLRRAGFVLIAIAFFCGGLPWVAAAAPAAAPAVLMHDMDCGHAAPDPAAPSPKAPVCQHANDCLVCVAVVLPTGVRPVLALRWTRLTFQPATLRLSGVTPQPELSPPIRRS